MALCGGRRDHVCAPCSVRASFRRRVSYSERIFARLRSLSSWLGAEGEGRRGISARGRAQSVAGGLRKRGGVLTSSSSCPYALIGSPPCVRSPSAAPRAVAPRGAFQEQPDTECGEPKVSRKKEGWHEARRSAFGKTTAAGLSDLLLLRLGHLAHLQPREGFYRVEFSPAGGGVGVRTLSWPVSASLGACTFGPPSRP